MKLRKSSALLFVLEIFVHSSKSCFVWLTPDVSEQPFATFEQHVCTCICSFSISKKAICCYFWCLSQKGNLKVITANTNDCLGWLLSPFSGSTSSAWFRLLSLACCSDGLFLRLLCLLALGGEHGSREMAGVLRGWQRSGYGTRQSWSGTHCAVGPCHNARCAGSIGDVPWHAPVKPGFEA